MTAAACQPAHCDVTAYQPTMATGPAPEPEQCQLSRTTTNANNEGLTRFDRLHASRTFEFSTSGGQGEVPRRHEVHGDHQALPRSTAPRGWLRFISFPPRLLRRFKRFSSRTSRSSRFPRPSRGSRTLGSSSATPTSPTGGGLRHFPSARPTACFAPLQRRPNG